MAVQIKDRVFYVFPSLSALSRVSRNLESRKSVLPWLAENRRLDTLGSLYGIPFSEV